MMGPLSFVDKLMFGMASFLIVSFFATISAITFFSLFGKYIG